MPVNTSSIVQLDRASSTLNEVADRVQRVG
jgi:hypothetical protein